MNTLTDPHLRFAFWAGAGSLALALMLAGQIAYLRLMLLRYQRQEKACIARWRPVLNAALVGMAPDRLPELSRREQTVFLQLWIHLQESLRGEARDALNDIGYRLGCDSIANRFLRRRSRGYQLLGILTLGHLRTKSAWSLLLEHAGGSDSMTSVHALWAMVQIDPAAAAEQMATTVIEREDWPLSHVARILQDAKEAWTPVLVAKIPDLDDAYLPRALRIAAALRVDLPVPLLSRLLRHASPVVLTAALPAATTPGLLADIRAHLHHPDWQVRVHVAKALGQVGDSSDIERLLQLLTDTQWWVRYRAAQALIDLPFLGEGHLDELCRNASDKFAGDMLKHVLAERAMQ